MGLQENSLQENVGQFFSVVFYFAFLTDFGGALITVDVLLTRVSDPLLLVMQTSQEPRGKWMTAKWYGAHQSFWSWGTFHPQGFGLWKLKGKADSFPVFCYFKMPFIWWYSCSLATYERKKKGMFFEICTVLSSKMFFPHPCEFSSQNERNWVSTR